MTFLRKMKIMPEICSICGTDQNIVHSGVDAWLLSINLLTTNICYECASNQFKEKEENNA